MKTNIKALATYMVPKIDVLFSAAHFRSLPVRQRISREPEHWRTGDGVARIRRDCTTSDGCWPVVPVEFPNIVEPRCMETA
jgi:hypothetical protein